MREMAYLYSEGRMLRWLTLMAADRVNMIEEFPRRWVCGRSCATTRRGLAKKVAITGLAVVLVAAYLRSHRR
jgi:hypothetical protein